MGLTTWKHTTGGKVLRSDVTVAKNYLSEAHIGELNRIVSAYLDLAGSGFVFPIPARSDLGMIFQRDVDRALRGLDHLGGWGLLLGGAIVTFLVLRRWHRSRDRVSR